MFYDHASHDNTHRIPEVNTTRIRSVAMSVRMLADRSERARRLSKAIKDAGHSTIGAAAERHHYKASTLTSHANGTREFDLEAGYEYARKFKVDPVWLLGLRAEPGKEPIPTVADLRGMIEAAIRELPLGASVEDYVRTVSASLRDQLEQYLTVGALAGSAGAGTPLGTVAQLHRPTTPDEQA